MNLLIVATFVGVVSAAKLDNTYLPPSSARTAGGSGNFLSTPFQGSQSGGFAGGSFAKFGSGFPNVGVGRYNQHAAAPAPVYGAPSGSVENYNQQGGSFIPSQGARGNYNAPTPEYGAPDAGAYYRNGDQPSYRSNAPQILRYNNENNGDGTYRFAYETENKIAQHEQGQLKNPGTDQESNVVEGSYSYPAPDGKTITVNYVADENGFHASGDHLPVAPPIPDAIQKSLQTNSASDYQSANGQYYNQGNTQQNGQYYTRPNEQYQSGQISRQYLSPNTQFDEQSGYRY